MKLQYRIIIPVALIICLIIGAVLGVSYTYTSKLLEGNVNLLTMSKVEEMKTTIDDRTKDVEIVKTDLNAQSIIKARAVAMVVANNPKILTDAAALQKLSKALDVEEIHICDGKGVLRWGTVKDFFGFDFATTDQTKPFMAALTDKNFELAQDPSPRGTDKKLFQYIGVARLDQPGIIQVGVSPTKLQDAMDKADIGTISSKIVFGKSGYGFIIDNKSGNILSYKDKAMIGKPATEIGLDTASFSTQEGSLRINSGKEVLALSYLKYKDYVICSEINENEFTGGLSLVLKMLIIIAVVSIVLASLIIYIIVKYFVIKEIQKIILVLKEIGKGNLRNELKVNSSLEFKELSKGINDMEADLKTLISENVNILEKLEGASEKLASAASHSSASASELADTVTEMAEGAQDQSESASNGAILAKNALEKLQSIKGNVEETVSSTTETQKSIKDGIKIVDHQIEAMKKNSASSNAVNQAVSILAEKTIEIDNIVNVITAIATETNMLALNAAIEAARAGEAGKGFAVVADEVRKLAENSTGSAKKIADIISEIRTDIENVQEQVNESIHAVEEQEKTVERVQETYGNIAEQTNQAVDRISAIYNATKSIYDDIGNIVKVVEGTAAVSEESAAATEEMSASIEELSAIMQHVDTISGDLKGLIQELDKTNSRFTI